MISLCYLINKYDSYQHDGQNPGRVSEICNRKTMKGSSMQIYRGSYISAHVLLSLLNELGKKIKCEACRAFYLFFATSLINSIIQEHEC